MSAIVFSPVLGPVELSCYISESHNSQVEISENPIEDGSNINDHAYIQPKKVILEIADANAADTYQALLSFQESRQPFSLITGLKVYENMLIKSIDADRDKKYANVLKARVELQEAIIVSTAIISVDVSNIGRALSGKPGGSKSNSATNPSTDKNLAPEVKNRVSGTVQRGDTPAKTVENNSILSQVFG